MLTIEVELLHETIRAGSADDITLTGHADSGEWPPSPARLFAALVAADGTRNRCRFTDGSELTVLEQALPPMVMADGPGDVLVSPQVDRFVVDDKSAKGSSQEYVARKNTQVRPSSRLSPRTPSVVYAWPDLALAESQLRSLRVRAARIGYLGCADSPVRVRVADSPPQTRNVDRSRWEPSAEGSTLVAVPFPGLVEVLDRSFDDFARGLTPRRAWYRVERQRYAPPGAGVSADRPRPEAVWLRFGRTASGRHVVAVTEALRAAVLAAYQQHVAGPGQDLPRELHGHGFDVNGYDHVSWLALPDVAHRYASGRIHGAAVLLPPSCPAEVVEGVRSAIWHIRRLRLPSGLVWP